MFRGIQDLKAVCWHVGVVAPVTSGTTEWHASMLWKCDTMTCIKGSWFKVHLLCYSVAIFWGENVSQKSLIALKLGYARLVWAVLVAACLFPELTYGWANCIFGGVLFLQPGHCNSLAQWWHSSIIDYRIAWALHKTTRMRHANTCQHHRSRSSVLLWTLEVGELMRTVLLSMAAREWDPLSSSFQLGYPCTLCTCQSIFGSWVWRCFWPASTFIAKVECKLQRGIQTKNFQHHQGVQIRKTLSIMWRDSTEAGNGWCLEPPKMWYWKRYRLHILSYLCLVMSFNFCHDFNVSHYDTYHYCDDAWQSLPEVSYLSGSLLPVFWSLYLQGCMLWNQPEVINSCRAQIAWQSDQPWK